MPRPTYEGWWTALGTWFHLLVFWEGKTVVCSSSLSNSTETAILTLAWQALYPRSHLSSTSLSLQGKQLWCFLLLSRGISDLTESYVRLIPRDSGISEHEKKTYWVETLTALSSLGFMYAQNVLDVPTNRGATALWYAVSPWPCALWAYPSSHLSILISRALFYNKISIFLFLIMSPWQSSIVVGYNYLDIWKVSLGMVGHCSYTQVFNYNIWQAKLERNKSVRSFFVVSLSVCLCLCLSVSLFLSHFVSLFLLCLCLFSSTHSLSPQMSMKETSNDRHIGKFLQ